MVLEIRLSNFFSIKEEVVLDMRAGNSKSQQAQALEANTMSCGDERVLKSVALYGANASGKSNIVKAIRFCCAMVFMSHTHNENSAFNFAPFKFDGWDSKPSSFRIRFVSGGIEYDYAFTLTRSEIVTEELYYYPNGRRSKVFTRDERAGTEKRQIYSFGAAIRKPVDVAENTSRKTLYISRASQMDRDIAKEVFLFFSSRFILQYPQNVMHFEQSYKENRETLLRALKIADSDIVNVHLSKVLQPNKNVAIDFENDRALFQERIMEHLVFSTYHKANASVPFDMQTEESAGTQALFFIMLNIIDIVKNDKILLIDEIETSLHGKIVEYIVELFHASRKAQIIYTTHNTSLLSLERLRKDQIYFVNKRDDSSSDLYSLFDYKDFRDTMDVEKAYLQGRFDAIPYIDDSLSNLKTLVA
jgi:AAA15 family ATPase/GTPase